MKSLFFIIVFVFLLNACTEDSVQYVKLANLNAGEKVQIIFLTVEKEVGTTREEEILKKISAEIAGKKKIIAVKTVYKRGFLFSAEIIYVFSEQESGLKIKYLTSSAKNFSQREKEIKSLVEGILEEIFELVAIQSVYQNGYLIAAEIYYKE